MKNRTALKITASTLVIGVTMVGCTSTANMNRPAMLASTAAKADKDANSIFQNAQLAVQQNRMADALRLAEQAVALSPRDSGYRMLLGDLYLKNGRFTSAESAFTDVLTLDRGNPRASLSLVLAQIALGKTAPALATLDQMSQTAEPSDLGLAYALAGQPQRAVSMLEPAARAAGATGRVRQNLALAYALSGDWQKARVTAAQDLSPADLDERLRQWAAFAQPQESHTQVAAVLGVTAVADAGQPQQLALVETAPAPVALAAAEAPAAVDYAEAYTPPPPVGEPIEIAEVEADPAANAPVDIQEAATTRLAAAVDTLVKTEPVVSGAPAAPALRVEPTIPTFKSALVRNSLEARPARKGPGRFVVQLGAYKNQRQVEAAWSLVQRRYRLDREPLSTTVSIPGKGMFHRLSLAGFDSHMEASRSCGAIKARGGACFVRATAGDAPVRWASRGAGKNA